MSMNVADIIKRAASEGVLLHVAEGELRFKLKLKEFPIKIKNEIIAHKQEIISYLARIQLNKQSASKGKITPVDRSENMFVTSYAQQRLLLIDNLQGGTPEYNSPMAFEISGKLDIKLLTRVFNTILSRHEIIRTVYVEQAGNMLQQIRPISAIDFTIHIHDFSKFSHKEQRSKVKHLMELDFKTPFNLAQDLMLRVSYLKTGDESGVLLMNMHHIASDGWSMEVLTKEFIALYNAYARKEESPLEPLKIQYVDYAQWQRGSLEGDRFALQLAYWEKQLSDLPAVHSLRLDLPRPDVKQHEGAIVTGQLSADVAKRLLEIARQYQLTPYMLLHGVLSLVLSKHSNSSDIVIGSPVANRLHEELESLIGFFVNTLVLRTNTDHRTLIEYFEHVRQVHLKAQANQDVPFEQLVDRLKPVRSKSYSPLFQILLMINTDYGVDKGDYIETLNLSGVNIRPLVSELVQAKFDLKIDININSSGVGINWTYDKSIFIESHCAQLNEHLCTLLTGLAQLEEKDFAGLLLKDLTLLSSREIESLTSKVDFEPVNEIDLKCLHSLFEEQVEKTPDNIALMFDKQQMTYNELNQRANQLACYLGQYHDIQADTLVGLYVERSVEMVVAILAILKAGGAYVPLDSNYPHDRLEYMIEDSQLKYLISTSTLLGKISFPDSVNRIVLDNPALQAAISKLLVTKVNLSNPIHPKNLAYVIYTSGSTGRPKGVLQTHENVARLFAVTEPDFNFGAADIWTLFHSISFDFSVWELWGPLLYGGRLVIPDYECTRDTQRFINLCVEQQVTVLNQTPSAFQFFCQLSLQTNKVFPSLRFVIFGGEELNPASVNQWWQRYGEDSTKFVNMYGITETTVHVTFKLLSADDQGQSFVGYPLGDQAVYILDHQRQLVPFGVEGEMYVGGAGLARGYLNQPELTSERFIANPFALPQMHNRNYSRLYKTGDVACFATSGELIYLGRNDQQIKIRGFRIELGEIEQQLAQLNNVSACTVVDFKNDNTEIQLIAYVVLKHSAVDMERYTLIESLKSELGVQLPDYMLPSVYIILDKLPLTLNGKIDKKSLPSPHEEDFAKALYVPPGNALEQYVCEVWKSALNIENLGINDDFFNIGGHSLVVVQIVNHIQEYLGEIIHFIAIYDAPTVAAFSTYLKSHYHDILVEKGLLSAELQSKENNNLLLKVETAQKQINQLIVTVPKVEHLPKSKNPKAIFLLSAPRSGSTLIRSMLAGHPKLFAPPELELLGFSTLSERSKAFSGRYKFWLEGALRAIMELKGVDFEQAKELMLELEKQGMSTKAFYKLLQSWIGDSILVDKTPSYAYHLEILRQAEAYFEEAHYIHLIRHPYGMINSFEEAHLQELLYLNKHHYTSKELAELLWVSCQKNIVTFLDAIPQERQHRVLFEDLLSDPEGEMHKLCDSLGIPFDDQLLNPYDSTRDRMTDGVFKGSRMLGDVKFHEHKKINSQAKDSWKKYIKKDFLADISWQLAEKFGYSKKDIPIKNKLQNITPLQDENNLPLSFSQQRLWFIDSLQGGSPEYNMPWALEVSGDLDLDLLSHVFDTILERHEILRTVYVEEAGEVLQHICSKPDIKFSIVVEDVSHLISESLVKEVKRLVEADVVRAFDLSNDVMLRVSYVKTASQAGVLLFNMHHIASDGWSMNILSKEFIALYGAFSKGQKNPLPDLEVQYKDYAYWQRNFLEGEVLDSQFRYWEKQLDGIPTVHNLPLDYPRQDVKQHNGAVLNAQLSAQVAQKLLLIAKQYRLTPFMLLHGALALLLSRHSNSSDIVVGTPVANRLQAGLEPLIGFFVNTLVLRVNTNHNTLTDYFSHIRQVHLDAQLNQSVPFEQLVEMLKIPRSKAHDPLFQIMMTTETDYGLNKDVDIESLDIPGLHIRPFESDFIQAKFDLNIDLNISEKGVGMSWIYNTSLFSRQHITQLNDHLCIFLEALAQEGDVEATALSSISILSESEIRHLVYEQNDTAMNYPRDMCIHELFEQQVLKNPQKVAVVYEDSQLSYKELNEKANQLAHFLKGNHKVTADAMVGLCVERSLEMIICIFGILKAGGGYFPLDLEHGVEVLNRRIQDSGLVAVIYSDKTAEHIQSGACPKLNINKFYRLEDNPNEVNNLDISYSSESLAYVMSSSGTTGKPKLIGLPHRALTNLFFGVMAGNDILSDSHKVLQFASVGFDMSFTDIALALLQGGSLYIIPENVRYNINELVAIIQNKHISLLNLPCSILKVLAGIAQQQDLILPSLEIVISTAEKLEVNEEIKQFFLLNKKARLINHFGPTETHVCTTCNLSISPTEWRNNIPIGKPISNSQCYVLGPGQTLSPKGCVGELYIGGDCLAVGYIGNQQLTDEKFQQINIPNVGFVKLYKTGDLVKWQDDNLLYVGRTDDQIKVNGYRIELNAIEELVKNHPDVDNATVLYDGKSEILSCYYSSNISLNELELRNFLVQKVPFYMVPRKLVLLETFPLTVNGKVDKKFLLDLDLSKGFAQGRKPETEIEIALANIWAVLLEISVDEINMESNFFALGGTSIVLIKVLYSLQKQFSLNVQVDSLYEYQNLSSLSEFIDEEISIKKIVNLESEESQWEI